MRNAIMTRPSTNNFTNIVSFQVAYSGHPRGADRPGQRAGHRPEGQGDGHVDLQGHL